MLEFIKMFGLGILYTILFPLMVVFFGIVLVYTVLNYLVLEVINFVGFFFGNTFTTETELEKKLKEMRMSKKENSVVEASAQVVYQYESNPERVNVSEQEGGDNK